MNEAYKPIMTELQQVIVRQHEKYGLSYREESLPWLRKRLNEEIEELSEAMRHWLRGGDRTEAEFLDDIVLESLDVAVCALMLADQARIMKKETEPLNWNEILGPGEHSDETTM